MGDVNIKLDMCSKSGFWEFNQEGVTRRMLGVNKEELGRVRGLKDQMQLNWRGGLKKKRRTKKRSLTFL